MLIGVSPALLVAARALALAVLGAALGLGATAARTGGLHLSRPAPVAACEDPAIPPVVVAPAEAARVCAAERALIADARPAAAFAAGHIAGAVHLPCDAGGDAASVALAHLADRTVVLVYGAGTADAVAVARSIAQRRGAAGGPKVYALDGGFQAWERAGLACASGPCDDCAAAPLSR